MARVVAGDILPVLSEFGADAAQPDVDVVAVIGKVETANGLQYLGQVGPPVPLDLLGRNDRS